MIRTIAFLLIAGLFLGACGDKAAESEGGAEKHEEHDEHAHAAKHGGDLLELGAHDGFLEVLLDHANGTVTIWPYLGEEMKDVKLSKDPVLNFKSSNGPIQVTAELTAGKWVFTHEALKGEPEGARFRIEMAGKKYNPTFDHAHDHDEHEGHDHAEGEGHDEDDGHDEHDGHDHG